MNGGRRLFRIFYTYKQINSNDHKKNLFVLQMVIKIFWFNKG